MNLDEIKATFFQECSDLMSELEEGLFSISTDNPDVELINSLFRAVHSIKGGAGSFALDDLVAFAHVFESSLDVLRVDISALSDERVKLLSQATDRLSDMINSARDNGDPVACDDIVQELQREFDLEPQDENGEEEVAFEAVPISIEDFDLGPIAENGTYTIVFTPMVDLYLVGNDPQLLFRELRALGSCTITCDADQVPALDEFDTNETYLSWTIELETEHSEDDIRSVFEWVEASCGLSITRTDQTDEEAGADLDDFLAALDVAESDNDNETEAPELESAENAALVDDAAPVEDAAAESDKPETADDEIAGNQATRETAAVKETKQSATRKDQQSAGKAAKTMRVDSHKVDKMINLMGELVIGQSMLTEQLNMSNVGSSSPVGLALAGLQNLTREIQASVMAIRAQPIKPIFMRMSRVIREICHATDKKAELVLEGECTEVDSTVIEGLVDPLTHMIRNAVDHGIESPEKRAELGKSEQGTIMLSASHNSGQILIEIKDDGAGINREKVLKTAMERGIVASDAALSDAEIDDLIFAPGFSTADEITDLSGRGVGMDVVRQSIQSMGGRVSITSEPGRGSHFLLSLPLTLAILDGMVVNDADQVFIVPISSVVETLKVSAGDIFKIGNDTEVIKLRGNLVPIVDVAHELGFAAKRDSNTSSTILVVEGGVNTQGALVVDAIVGQQQVVIKSLEHNYRRISGIAAATILGNGRIALVLDSEDIIRRKANEFAQQGALKLSA